MRLVREKDGAVIAAHLAVADSFGRRLLGLMGRRRLADGEGLWLEPCDAIHMMFMRFAIDAVFVRRLAPEGPPGPGARGEVLAIRPGVRPWLGFARCPGAASVIELPAGSSAATGVSPGDRLRLDPEEAA